MSRTVRIILGVLIVLLLIAGGVWQFTHRTKRESSLKFPVNASQDGFQAAFPMLPQTKLANGTKEYRALGDKESLYLVSSTLIRSEHLALLTNDEATKAYYKALMEQGIQSFHGQLISSEATTIDGRLAWHFTASAMADKKERITESYIVNSKIRTYFINASYWKGEESSKQTREFFASFRVVE